MNLYLISQTKNNDYDTFDSAVVAAETEKEARVMRPSDGGDITTAKDKYDNYCWVNDPNEVLVALIGTAVAGRAKGVVLSSFNAG